MARPVNADVKRREIVAGAAALFDRAGYHQANVRQIAEAAGIRKATLYHYVASKEDLLTLIHEEFIDLLLEKQAARPDDLPAGDELRAVMGDVLELMETHRGHVRVFFEHHRELPPEAQREIRRKRDLYRDGVERAIARGVRSGELRRIDPRLATLAFFGMCNWAYQWYAEDGPLTAGEIAGVFSDLLLNGLTG